jgi:hypothetical protein
MKPPASGQVKNKKSRLTFFLISLLFHNKDPGADRDQPEAAACEAPDRALNDIADVKAAGFLPP